MFDKNHSTDSENLNDNFANFRNVQKEDKPEKDIILPDNGMKSQ